MTKYCLFTVYLGSCLLLSLGGLSAQSQDLHLMDTTLARQYQEQAEVFADSAQYDSAIVYYEQAAAIYEPYLQSSRDTSLWKAYLECNNRMGYCYRRLGNYEKSLSLLLLTLDQGKSYLGDQSPIVAESYNGIAVVYNIQGAYKAALENHSKAIQIRIKVLEENHPDIASSYHNMGVVYYNQGTYNAALQSLDRALQIRKKTFGENHPDIAMSYNSIGIVHMDQGFYEKALEFYQKALNIRLISLGTKHPYTANCYNNIGIVYAEQGAYEKALEFYQKALPIRLATLGEMHPYVAASYHNIGIIYEKQAAYQEALGSHQKALKIKLVSLGNNHPDVATSYNSIGNIFRKKEAYEEALEFYQKALNIRLMTLGEKHPLVADIYHNMGIIHREKRAYKFALENYQKSLEIKLTTLGEKHPDVASTFNSIGNVYSNKAAYKEALTNQQNALAILLVNFGENHPDVAMSFNNIGIIHQNIGNHETAVDYYQKALAIQLSTFGEKHPDVAETHKDIGGVYLDQGFYLLALENFQQALIANSILFEEKDININPQLTDEILSEIQLLETLQLKAYTLFDRYLHQSHRFPDLHLASQTYELATQVIDQIRMGYKREGDKEELLTNAFEVYEGLIKVNEELWKKTNNSIYIRQAFHVAEKSKSTLLIESLRESEAQQFAGIPDTLLKWERELEIKLSGYHQLISNEQTYGQEADSAKLNLWQSKVFHLNRSRDSLLKIMEQNYPDYYRLKYDFSVAKLEDVQANLSDSTTIIEYFMGDSNLYIFTITHDQSSLHKVPIDSSFHIRLKRFISLVNTPTIGSEIVSQDTTFQSMVQLGHQLYQELLTDAFSSIEANQLIIIPDGLLGYLPFELLLTTPAEPGEYYGSLSYLLRTHNIRYEYAATLLLEEQTSRSSKPSSSYVGYAPSYPKKDDFLAENRTLGRLYPSVRDGWGSLIYNQPEVRAASQLMKGTSYLDTTATERTFKRTAGQYQILHLAMHALLNDSLPLYSGLAFAANSDSTEDGFLHAYELYNLPLKADLAVLSACHSGAGKIQRGEGIMSLARAFKYAGCPNIVMSLWQADDLATADIITAFFGYLKQKMPKDEALRKAKLEYLDNVPPTRQHPFYWGTLTLVGDDQPIEMFAPLWYYLIGFLLLFILAGLIGYMLHRRKKF